MKIGDRVKFLNDTGGGIITKFIGQDKVLVKIEEGFEVPTMLNQIMPDAVERSDLYPDDKNPCSNKSNRETVKATQTGEASGIEIPEVKNSGKVYLAFIHEHNPVNAKIYLINDTNYYIYYIVGIRKMEQQLYKYSGFLEPNTKMILGLFKMMHPDEPTIFSVQYIGYKKGYYEPMDPVNHILELNTRKLADREYENENDFFESPASVFEIFAPAQLSTFNHLNTSEIKKNITDMNKESHQKSTGRKKTTSDIMEIDLHIHEIIEDQRGLTDGEILEIQLKRFETALETAMRGIVGKIIFIHGVGQGRLKFEITKILNNKYPDMKYQDASFREYGYGAIMVIL